MAGALFVKEAVGSVLRPIVNTSAKVTKEIVRKIDCATQGLSISSGCGTPSPWQDYWGTIMTGEGRGYTMTAVVLDAFGMVPVLAEVARATDESESAFAKPKTLGGSNFDFGDPRDCPLDQENDCLELSENFLKNP
jgi:hypothetical protein